MSRQLASAIFVTATLCACANAAKDAEERYEMVKRTGTKGELCNAAREVADTYLREKDDPNYRMWHNTAAIQCQLAELTSPNDPAQETADTLKARADAERVAADAMAAARGTVDEETRQQFDEAKRQARDAAEEAAQAAHDAMASPGAN